MDFKLPVLRREEKIERLPFDNEFITFVLEQYLFAGKNVLEIEKDYFESEYSQTGAFASKVLDYFSLLDEHNKGLYNGEDVLSTADKLINEDNSLYKNIGHTLKRDFNNSKVEYIVADKERLTGGFNKIYYGVPGCGKSYKVNQVFNKDDYHIIRTTFYPEYTNSDFIGQIIPKLENEKVVYKFHAGAFTEALLYALLHKKEKVCLIIEEINRGNASSIFGEVFQLLDRDDDGNSCYPIFNNFISDYLEEKGIILNNIVIPSNLWIVATMNTSDQNVFTLDTAFQRRWTREYIPNVFESDKTALGYKYSQDLKNTVIPFNGFTNITWGEFVTRINKKILTNRFGINGEDKQLGVYSVTINELKDKRQFFNKVLVYIFDDIAKINKEEWFEDIDSYDELLDAYDKNYLTIFTGLFDDVVRKTGETNE